MLPCIPGDGVLTQAQSDKRGPIISTMDELLSKNFFFCGIFRLLCLLSLFVLLVCVPKFWGGKLEMYCCSFGKVNRPQLQGRNIFRETSRTEGNMQNMHMNM